MPVINENDTTATDEITFGDNDFLAAQVAILIGAERLIILTNSDGLHTADPRSDPRRALVERVDDFAALDALEITQTTSAHGSGGMRSKVVAADMATAAGIETVICSGVARRRARARARRRARGDAVRRRAAVATRASSCGCATRSRAAARSSSTPARRARCARAARACCRSGSSRCAASSSEGDAVEVVARRRR